MECSRINAVAPPLVALFGPKEGPSERVLSALVAVTANVCVVQTTRQLRVACRDQSPDLIVLEMPELGPARLNAEIHHLRGAGVSAPLFVISTGASPGDRLVIINDVVDFATAQATSSEIAARIARALRQVQPQPRKSEHGEDSWTADIDGVHLDWRTNLVSYEGKSVRLTSSELRLFEAFIEHRGELLSTGALLRAVWGESRHHSDSLVAVYIFALRGKLHQLGGSLWIENVVGSGYRLTGVPTTRRRKKPARSRVGSTRSA